MYDGQTLLQMPALVYDDGTCRTRKPAISEEPRVRWCTRSTWPWTTL